MRIVRAVAIGPAAFEALKAGHTGEVHSVFERTFNILINGQLVGVALDGVPLSPIDLITDISSSEKIPSLGVRKGAPVLIVDNRIIVENVFEISLGQARHWCSRTLVEKPLAQELILHNLEQAKKIAVGKSRNDGLGQLLAHVDTIVHGEIPATRTLNRVAKAALPRIVSLVNAVKSDDIGNVKEIAGSLIGLGPGLTPSADDMLSGFTSSLWWVSQSLGKGVSRVKAVNEAVVSQASATNLLSRQLLQHAARGEVNEYSGELLEVLLAGSVFKIEQSVERVMGIGETSGMDMIVGILLGLQLGLEIIPSSLA